MVGKDPLRKNRKHGGNDFSGRPGHPGGDDIPEEIRRQILQSKEIVVLLTPESIDSKWVMLEVGAAWGLGERIRILLIRCHVGIDPIPAVLKSRKSISLNELDGYLNELTLRIRD